MRVKLFTLLASLFLVIGPCLLVGQDSIRQLSTDEKLADFEFLFTEFEESYPYFGINKRQNGVDWLGNKELYAEKVKATTNDKEYIATIEEIVFELGNGHTDLYPTTLYDYFYDGYSQMMAEVPHLSTMVEELERFGAKEKVKYWQKLLKDEEDNEEEASDGEAVNEEASDEETSRPAKLSTVINGRTMIVNLPSFGYEKIEADADELKDIFKKAHKYDNLILNIQGNSGGSEDYWQEHIVAHLLDDEISYPIVMAFKNSERLKRFKPGYTENLTYEALGLPNLPPELSTGDYLFSRDTNFISPTKRSKHFAGKVYLLVDEVVYSSAEALAYFCKVTGFAEVVGQTTSGDGIGSDPLLLTLPKSGIVIRFTGEMGLNPDGSANEETKTVPDILLTGATAELRLEQLLERIGKR
jgi:hypothetical protein